MGRNSCGQIQCFPESLIEVANSPRLPICCSVCLSYDNQSTICYLFWNAILYDNQLVTQNLGSPWLLPTIATERAVFSSERARRIRAPSSFFMPMLAMTTIDQHLNTSLPSRSSLLAFVARCCVFDFVLLLYCIKRILSLAEQYLNCFMAI